MPLLINRWILSHCVAEITGPMCAPLAGSPTVVASAAVLAIAIASAMREFGTSMRVGALHDWPELPMTPRTPAVTALLKSASARMMFGDLPPSSWCTRLTVWAALRATSMPARVEPVNDTMSMSGWLAIAAPTVGPSPFTRLKTPAGTPAGCMISVHTWAEQLLYQQRRCALFLERVLAQHAERRLQMRQAYRRLRILGQRDRSAHLFGDRRSHVGVALLVLGNDALQQGHTLADTGLRKAGKGRARSLHGTVHILGRAHRDAPGRGLGRGVDDIDAPCRYRIDPVAIDVKLQVVTHVFLLQKSAIVVPSTEYIQRLPTHAGDSRQPRRRMAHRQATRLKCLRAKRPVGIRGAARCDTGLPGAHTPVRNSSALVRPRRSCRARRRPRIDIHPGRQAGCEGDALAPIVGDLVGIGMPQFLGRDRKDRSV